MSYDMIDRFLRNNLSDDDYAEYSSALDSLCTPQSKQEQGEPVAFDEWCKELAQALGQSICVIDDEVRLRKTTLLESLYWKRPAQQRKPLWIASKDQLPPEGERVFWMDECSNRVGYDTWMGPDFRWTPSHWMRIPANEAAHGIAPYAPEVRQGSDTE